MTTRWWSRALVEVLRMIERRLLGVLLALSLLAPVVASLGAARTVAVSRVTAQQQVPSQQRIAASQQAISREEALRQLAVVRASIDQMLELVQQGKIDQAYALAKTGYLDHFEYVEVPLRVVAPDLTADAETKFVEIRGLIKSGASVDTVRTNIVELRRLIDDTERRLTATGFDAVAVVAGQSFLIIFREGLEAVLLLTALLGYVQATKSTRYRKPVAWGVILGLAATALTYLSLRFVLAVLPVGGEVLEAVVATAAVAVLMYISFWLIARLERRRWMEFLRSRLFNAGVDRVHHSAGVGGIHRDVPGGPGDCAALPGDGRIRSGAGLVDRGRVGGRSGRLGGGVLPDLQTRPAAAGEDIPGGRCAAADGDLGGVPR